VGDRTHDRHDLQVTPRRSRAGRASTSRAANPRASAREALTNVALRVEETTSGQFFQVYGRGELHWACCSETCGAGLRDAVSRPRVVTKEIDGKLCEPYEILAVDIEDSSQGAVMTALGSRGGQLQAMHPDGQGPLRLDYVIPRAG